MYERFTDRARKVMQLANHEAQRFNHEYIGTEHILLGLVTDGSGVAANVLKNLDIDLRKLRHEVEKIVLPGPETVTVGKAPQTPRAKKVIEYAIEEARKLNHNYVGTEHLLLGLLREQEGVAAQVLMNLGLKLDDLRGELLTLLGHDMATQVNPSGGSEWQASERKTPALDSFGRDLTELARQGKLDPVVGRTDAIERLVQVLCCRTEVNPILLGESGVGKTAIVERLARLVADSQVPEPLRQRRLIDLDLATMIAGGRERGQLEERTRAMIHEVRRAGNIILFIEGLYSLVGAGGAKGTIAANLFRRALARGQVQCISAATPDEYRRSVEEDAALAALFQPVVVNPPSREEAVEILRGLRDRYESHHGVQIKDEALAAAVDLSDRYVCGRGLPGKAIQVLDEAGARVRLKATAGSPNFTEIDAQIEQLNREKEEAVAEQDFDRAAQLRDQADTLKRRKEQRLARERNTGPSAGEDIVDMEAVCAAVGAMTGVPLTCRLGDADTLRLLNFERELGEAVVGQPGAVAAVARVVRRSRAGLNDPARPVGSFLFAGPTGVGKTLLARRLAHCLLGGEKALVQVNMGQFAEERSVRRFLEVVPARRAGGHWAGNAGTHLPGVFVFDHIEKAHPAVRDLLLPLLDEGSLTDHRGRACDFKDAVLIMTTNAGAELLAGEKQLGFGRQDEAALHARRNETLRQVLGQTFRPEFLDRLDDVIAFGSLTRDDLKKIIDVELARVVSRLGEKNLTLTDAARDFLVAEGTGSEGSARPLRQALERYVADPLAEALLRGSFAGTDTITADVAETAGTRSLVFTTTSRKE